MVPHKSQYLILAVALSVALSIIFNIISFRTVDQFVTVQDFLIEYGIIYTTMVISLNLAIALLMGMVASALILKFRSMRAFRVRGGSCVASGAFITSTTAICPACSVPLLALLGFTGSLSIFPLQGLEFKLISLGLIALSLCWTSRGSSLSKAKVASNVSGLHEGVANKRQNGAFLSCTTVTLIFFID